MKNMVYIIEHPTRGYLREVGALSIEWTKDHRCALEFRSLAMLQLHLEEIENLFKVEGCEVRMVTASPRRKPTLIQAKARSEIANMLFGHTPKRRRRKKEEPAEELYQSVVFKDDHQILPYRGRTSMEVKTIISNMGMKLMSVEVTGKSKRAYYINDKEQELLIMKGGEPTWN